MNIREAASRVHSFKPLFKHRQPSTHPIPSLRDFKGSNFIKKKTTLWVLTELDFPLNWPSVIRKCHWGNQLSNYLLVNEKPELSQAQTTDRAFLSSACETQQRHQLEVVRILLLQWIKALSGKSPPKTI